MSRGGPRYSAEEARAAIAASLTYTEALRRLGMRAAGGNFATLRKYAEQIWHIPTDHFDYGMARSKDSSAQRRISLDQIMVAGSSYSRVHLKRRLLREGLKRPICELCGQGELWRGQRMALILDHINGIADDHRLENLRMVCPNCAATLPTHCAKQNRVQREPRECPGCGKSFVPLTKRQRFCQRRCWILHKRGRPQPDLRRVDRPPYTHLLREVAAIGYLATGRRYGVSDNAIRKWIRQYEKEQAAAKEPPEDLAA